MNTILVLVFFVNSSKISTVVEKHQTIQECEQSAGQWMSDLGDQIISANCH